MKSHIFLFYISFFLHIFKPLVEEIEQLWERLYEMFLNSIKKKENTKKENKKTSSYLCIYILGKLCDRIKWARSSKTRDLDKVISIKEMYIVRPQ